MRVLLVTGSYPPDVCGTADYSARLCDAMRAIGVDAHIFYRTAWNLSRVPALLREMEALRPDLVHMQYPTTGYGWKLGPQGIGSLRRLVITLHEASQSHALRQLSLYPFLLRNRHIIFTNPYEQKHVTRLAPWIAAKSSIIPIGCNLPIASSRPKEMNLITCFSIIRPNKGLEDVLAMARELRVSDPSVRVRILGAVMPRWAEYFSKLKAQSKSLPVEWMVGLTNDALSEVLAQVGLAYLPFPDGASERRSSLIAMLMNGACVLTTVGKHTPVEMAASVVAVTSPAEAAAAASQLLADPDRAKEAAGRGAAYARRFSWERIARQHAAIYQQCLQ